MSRTLVFAYVVLIGLALYVFGTTLWRMHEGRCRVGASLGAGRLSVRAGRGGLDCTYPAPPKRPGAVISR